jgi:hypothetical protein
VTEQNVRLEYARARVTSARLVAESSWAGSTAYHALADFNAWSRIVRNLERAQDA